jgi:hypothetical protein
LKRSNKKINKKYCTFALLEYRECGIFQRKVVIPMLGGKDILATIFTSGTVGLYYAKEKGLLVPLVSSNRLLFAVLLVVGLVVCAVSSSMGQNPWSNPWIVAASALGGAALLAAIIGLITGSRQVLLVFVSIIVLLWLLTTTRHIFYS